MTFTSSVFVILSFQAANDDELTIQETENLQIIGEGDGDGWLRVSLLFDEYLVAFFWNDY